MTRNKIMSRHVNLFYIDLDNFKKINDEYGHQVGDTALVMVAKLLKQTFSGDFLARIGGDEFLVVVLGEKIDAELAAMAETFLNGLQQSIVSNDKFLCCLPVLVLRSAMSLRILTC
ncbi:MAG: GGDEF domain-containing protein [Acidaminococcaceae bacterium]|nr:GGDEF domain-containing protein [Acidaminococcaceae bacterium]